MGKKHDELLQLVGVCMEQVFHKNLEDSDVSASEFVIVGRTLRELRRRLEMYDIYPDCHSLDEGV